MDISIEGCFWGILKSGLERIVIVLSIVPKPSLYVIVPRVDGEESSCSKMVSDLVL